MQRFSLKYFWVVAMLAVPVVSVLNADQTTEIRNSKRSMASGETTVFAQGESKAGSNTSWRGGLGVNFPAGGSVRLLMAQRPAMERILPGEKAVTQAATTSSGGYNKAAASSDSTASSMNLVPSSCTISYTPPYYSVSAGATLDTSNKDIAALPNDFAAEHRSAQGAAANLAGMGWTTKFNETDVASCNATGMTFPISCYLQARLRYKYTGAEADVSVVGKVCTFTNSTTYSWADFDFGTN
jgi:hypothetical protein